MFTPHLQPGAQGVFTAARVQLTVLLAVVAGAWLSAARAQDDHGFSRSGVSAQARLLVPAPGEPYQVAENLYLIPGGGGNTAVFIAADGVVIVDPKYPEHGEAVVAQVRRLTNKPIRFVINTHCHNDHFGGNLAMPMDAEIVLQEKTADNIALLRQTGDPRWFEGRRVRTFRDRLTLFEGRDAVDLYFFGPAHTAGDTFVVFRTAGVMQVGDVFAGKSIPVVNLPWGGSPRNYPAAIRQAVAVGNVTRVITGHGPVLDMQSLADHGELIQRIVDHVEEAMTSGRDWNQARTDLVLPPKFADYSLSQLDGTLHDVYRGLAGRRLFDQPR